MKKRLSKKALISVCTLIAVLLVLIIWTIWGNTAFDGEYGDCFK